MRKLGIFLTVIGLIQSVVLIVNLTSKGLDLELFITAICFIFTGIILFLIGNYRKKTAIKAGKKYKEMGWGKAIGTFFIVMFAIAIVGRIALSVTESSFEGQIKRANKDCPITVAGGTGKITSIKAENNMVVYTIQYDDIRAIPLSEIKSNPNRYKRVIILSSWLLNGQNGNGDRFTKLILDHKFGIAFNIEDSNKALYKIEVPYEELKSLLTEASKSPTEAMMEITEWQIFTEKKNMPIQFNEDMTLDGIVCDSTRLIFKMTMSDNLPINNYRKNNTVDNRVALLREMCTEAACKSYLEKCAVGKFDLVYRFININKTDSCDWIFTHEEIIDAVEIPKRLKIQ